MSQFGDDFAGPAQDHMAYFGGAGLTLLRASGTVSLPLAVVEQSQHAAVELYEQDGHRVAMSGTLTLPAAQAVDVTTDRLQRGADVWHIAGEVNRTDTLVTYALTRSRHVALRVIHVPGTHGGSR